MDVRYLPMPSAKIVAILAAGLLAILLGPGTGADTSDAHIIGPEDVIEITVWRHEDLSITAMVPQDGRVNLPFVGPVQAAGLTSEALARSVEQAYSPDYVKDCQATVTIREYRSRKVYVYGQVPRPGTYYLKARTTLREVLSEAGGVAATGNAQDVLVVRRGERIAQADINRLLTEGDLSQDVTLEAGDTVFVPFNTSNLVHVVGQVHRPGPIVVDDNERVTLLKVISKSGGPTDRADLDNAVLVREDGSKTPLHLDELLDRAQTEYDIELAPGDTVLVPEELENQIYVLGDVRQPGLYTVRGRVTAVYAISLAGGLTDTAVGSKTKIIRRGEKEPIVQNVDLTKILGAGDTSFDVDLQPRDIVFVPRSRLGKTGSWFNQFLPTLSTVLGIQQTIVFTKYLSE